MSHVETRNCFEERPGRVAREMRDSAGASERVQNPVYHLSISWPEEDGTTTQERVDAMKEVLEDIGLGDRQALIVEHDDGKNHVHAMVNRVQHDPYAEDFGTAWDDGHDWERIEHSLREIERDRGWREVPGKMSENHPKKREEIGDAMTRGQRKYTERTGELPVFKKAQIRAGETFSHAEVWDELDETLRRNDLKVELKGGGGIVRDLETGNACKLSSVGKEYSLGKLEQRFGETYDEYLERREEVAEQPVAQEPAVGREPGQRAEGRPEGRSGQAGRPDRGGEAEGQERREAAGRAGGSQERDGGAGGGDQDGEGESRPAPAEAEPITDEAGQDSEPARGGNEPNSAVQGDLEAERGSPGGDRRDQGHDEKHGGVPDGPGGSGNHGRDADSVEPLELRGADLIAESEETSLPPGEPITTEMSVPDQKETARRWAQAQVGQVSQVRVDRDITEIPTPELEGYMEDLRQQREAAQNVRNELKGVRREMGENPIGLRRRRVALLEIREASGRFRSRIEEQISQRPEEERELREALMTVKFKRPSGIRAEDVERARALLKADRLRSQIRRGGTKRGARQEGREILDEVDGRMEEYGLEEPLQKIKGGWTRSDEKEWFGEAGTEVLKAERNAGKAVLPEHRRTHRRKIYRERVEEALRSLSEKERERVRGELMKGRGERKEELRRIEKKVQREERAQDAEEPVVRALKRASQMEGESPVRRAEALDEAEGRFREIEEPVRTQVRERLDPGLEEKLEEALRPARQSASELRAGMRSENKSEGPGGTRDKGQSTTENQNSEGENQNGDSGKRRGGGRGGISR